MNPIFLVSSLVLVVTALVGCSEPTAASVLQEPGPVAAASPPEGGAAAPIALEDTAQHEITSETLGRTYHVYVSLPRNYSQNPTHRYPVLFITDTTYAFPLVRSIARMVGDKGDGLEDFVLVGLGYAKGDTSQYSRRRDYTPTPNGPWSASTSDMPGRPVRHGEAEAYRKFIRDDVFPFIAGHYQVDMQRRIFAGHSYGALLGAHMLLAEPGMFEKYILSSGSLWYDQGVMFTREGDYARQHDDLRAQVFMSMGSFETLKPGSGDSRYMTERDMLADMRRFEDQLRSRGYPGLRIQSTVIADEDHLSVYPGAISRGLKWALPPVVRR